MSNPQVESHVLTEVQRHGAPVEAKTVITSLQQAQHVTAAQTREAILYLLDRKELQVTADRKLAKAR